VAGADGHARPGAAAPDTGLWPALFWLAFFVGFYGYAHRLDLSDLFLTAGAVVGVAGLVLSAFTRQGVWGVVLGVCVAGAAVLPHGMALLAAISLLFAVLLEFKPLGRRTGLAGVLMHVPLVLAALCGLALATPDFRDARTFVAWARDEQPRSIPSLDELLARPPAVGEWVELRGQGRCLGPLGREGEIDCSTLRWPRAPASLPDAWAAPDRGPDLLARLSVGAQTVPSHSLRGPREVQVMVMLNAEAFTTWLAAYCATPPTEPAGFDAACRVMKQRVAGLLSQGRLSWDEWASPAQAALRAAPVPMGDPDAFDRRLREIADDFQNTWRRGLADSLLLQATELPLPGPAVDVTGARVPQDLRRPVAGPQGNRLRVQHQLAGTLPFEAWGIVQTWQAPAAEAPGRLVLQPAPVKARIVLTDAQKLLGVAALALLAWHALALVVSLAKWWFASRKG
jgi:hypothetical protein